MNSNGTPTQRIPSLIVACKCMQPWRTVVYIMTVSNVFNDSDLWYHPPCSIHPFVTAQRRNVTYETVIREIFPSVGPNVYPIPYKNK